ncbi:MAG: pyridoxal phosphate-dependent aminotransferase [Nitrospinota bacterium]
MRLADRMGRLLTESAFVVLARAKELERGGRDIIHLEIGEPDFDTPSSIVEAAYRALKEGATHYCPSQGLLELREAICEYFERTRGVRYSPEEVVVAAGAKPFLFYAIVALAQSGDEVIYPNPGFPVYESVIRYAGARPVALPILEANDFRFTVEEVRGRVNERTRLIILNYPHNPTGGTLTERELEAIAELARERDIVVLADEVYSNMLFEGAHVSIAAMPGMRERTILMDSHSKTYAMTGWRLGWVATNRELAAHLTKLITNSVSCTPPFVQLAGVEALRGPQEESGRMMEEFRRRRDLFVAGLNEVSGLSCKTPAGAFYAFPNVRKVGDCQQVAEALLEEAGVGCLAGTDFGEHGEGHIRFCFANSTEDLEKALDRIEGVVKSRLR